MSGGSQIFFGAATPACWTVISMSSNCPITPELLYYTNGRHEMMGGGREEARDKPHKYSELHLPAVRCGMQGSSRARPRRRQQELKDFRSFTPRHASRRLSTGRADTANTTYHIFKYTFSILSVH